MADSHHGVDSAKDEPKSQSFGQEAWLLWAGRWPESRQRLKHALGTLHRGIGLATDALPGAPAKVTSQKLRAIRADRFIRR